MDENVSFILESTEEDMKSAVDHLNRELTKIRAGKASPVMLSGVRVEYYGAMTPLNQVASVVAVDPLMLSVTPFDKTAAPAIEKAIRDANLGLNPYNDGELVRVPVPRLNEERRKQLVRQARDTVENAKISLRNQRRDANSELKKLKDENVSEDEIKKGEELVNNMIKKYSDQVDDILKKKESDIMTV